MESTWQLKLETVRWPAGCRLKILVSTPFRPDIAAQEMTLSCIALPFGSYCPKLAKYPLYHPSSGLRQRGEATPVYSLHLNGSGRRCRAPVTDRLDSAVENGKSIASDEVWWLFSFALRASVRRIPAHTAPGFAVSIELRVAEYTVLMRPPRPPQPKVINFRCSCLVQPKHRKYTGTPISTPYRQSIFVALDDGGHDKSINGFSASIGDTDWHIDQCFKFLL